MTEREERQRQKNLLLSVDLPKCPQLHLCVFHGCQELKQLGHHLLLPRRISRELNDKWSNNHSNRHSHVRHQCCKWTLDLLHYNAHL